MIVYYIIECSICFELRGIGLSANLILVKPLISTSEAANSALRATPGLVQQGLWWRLGFRVSGFRELRKIL